MAVLSEEDIKTLREELNKELANTVEVDIFIDMKKAKEGDPKTDIESFILQFIEDFKQITDKVKFNLYDTNEESTKEKIKQLRLNIDDAGNRISPIITFKDHPNIIYLGFPLGEEFPVFLEDLIHISKNEVHLSSKVRDEISKINKPVDIYVFVTMTCPYCPYMTHTSHQFALLNNNIRGIMVLSEVFNEFAEKYQVYAVPHIVIRSDNKDLDSWEGMVEESLFSKKIVEAISK